jgi:hypothetical protein
MKLRCRALFVCALLMPLPGPLSGQVWRSLNVERQVRDSSPLNVQVSFAEGSFELERAREERTYSMLIRYDAESVHPRFKFDSSTHTLIVGTEKIADRMRFGADDMGDARLELPGAVPANLSIDIGAASSTLDLGGLPLRSLHFRTGASQTLLRFNEPNIGVLSELTIDGSAGAIRATGLANARAPRMNVQAHLGTVDLDFSGEWTADIAVDLRIVLASAVLRVPRDVGVEIHAAPVLSSFAPEGFLRSGDVYRSGNWDAASRKLTITAHSILARLSIVRTAPMM